MYSRYDLIYPSDTARNFEGGGKREKKVIFGIEGEEKVRVKGYMQRFLKIVFRKSISN
jgi:hypothetical protein